MNLKVAVLFLGLALVGTVGINVVPSVSQVTLHTTTGDGVTIVYNIYQPNGLTQKTPVVIMGHGILVNKEMMTGFAMELATQGYIVASLDWRGHGQSTGDLSARDGLYRDLEAVIADIPGHAPADMERIALLGYSMGGSPTYTYAADHPAVKAWVGVGTAPDPDISDKNVPHNVLVIIAKYDEAFSPESARKEMTTLTGRAPDDIEFERIYGSITEGTARRIHVVPGADHLTTPWNSDFVLTATSWVKETFEGSPPDISLMVFHQRVLLFVVGLTGMIGFLFTFSSILAEKWHIHEVPGADITEKLTVLSFVGKYYAVTLLLFFTMVLFIPLFLTPLPFAALLATLTGGLSINVLVYCWFLARKSGNSIKAILKENLSLDLKTWVFSVVITVIFMVFYYFLVGLHFLGVVPSINRAPYLVLFCGVLFFTFWFYSVFVQKVSTPFLNRKLKVKSAKATFVLSSFINFLFIYSWFAIIVLVPCIIINNYFLAMILILMAPIFLFMSFFSVHMERTTGSTIPPAVLHGVWLGFVVTTLTAYISVLTLMD